MNKITKLLLALPLLLVPAGCENDDPIKDSQVTGAEIRVFFNMSPDELKYFDYALIYDDDEGYKAYTELDSPVFALNLSSGSLPTERMFKFIVTRKDTPAPAERVEWKHTFEVEVVRTYIDGHTDTVEGTDAITYTCLPANFEQWAESEYIPLVGHGYEVYVNYAGTVNFSFD